MRGAATTQTPGINLLALLRDRDRKPTPDARLQPLVLREQLEQRLHRSPTGWPSQPFQVSHGFAGAVGQKFLDETLHGPFGHESPQIAMILKRNGLNDFANKRRNHARARNGHIGPIQPLARGLLQPAPRQSRVCAGMKVFGEPLFDDRIKLAQSPLLDRPPLMFKPCPAAPIQRSQRRYVWNLLFELTTEMS